METVVYVQTVCVHAMFFCVDNDLMCAVNSLFFVAKVLLNGLGAI